MVDLGIHNFIKNALAQGQTKESVEAILLTQGMDKENIDAAFASVENGNAPAPQPPSSFSPSSSPTVPATSGYEQWQPFKDAFWKYFIIIFIAGVISTILKGYVSLIVLVVNIVCLFLIAGQIGVVTSVIRGKKSWPLMILGFFLPPAAFYFVYRMAKRNGWNISLNPVESVVVAIGVLLYVLWMLVIGGLIIAIVLAAQRPLRTPSVNQPTTLGPSSNKNSVLVETQLEMTSMQARAEEYYMRTGKMSYGSSPDCYSSGMFTDPKIIQSIKNISSYTGFSPTCGSNGQQYAIQVKIKDSAYACIDSKGKNVIDSVPISNNTFVCP